MPSFPTESTVRHRHFGLPTIQSLRTQAAQNLKLKPKHDNKDQVDDKSTKNKIVTKMIRNANAASAHAPPAQCQYAFL